jgi:hypothetical protein
MLVVPCTMGSHIPPKMFNVIIMYRRTRQKLFEYFLPNIFHVFLHQMCPHAKLDQLLKGCPYFAIIVKYLAKIVSFHLFVATHAHNTKWFPPSIPTWIPIPHFTNLSYVAHQFSNPLKSPC